MNPQLRSLLVGIIFLSLSVFSTGEAAPKKSLPKSAVLPLQAIMHIFDASGTRLIETVKAPSFFIVPDTHGSFPGFGVTTDDKGISLQGEAFVSGSGYEHRRFSAGEGGTIFRFEKVPVTLVMQPSANFNALSKSYWNGIRLFSWGAADSVGQLSMTDSLLFDLKAKTLEKTVESGTWTSRTSFKVRFLGVTPTMLEAITKEPHPRENAYCSDWGQEVYLPKYGARIVEILQASKSMVTSVGFQRDWKQWKAQVIWRCPQPKN